MPVGGREPAGAGVEPGSATMAVGSVPISGFGVAVMLGTPAIVVASVDAGIVASLLVIAFSGGLFLPAWIGQ